MSQTSPSTPGPEMRLDTSQLKSGYCNVCSATSNREEVVLNFGLNQNWDQAGAQPGTQAMDVLLLHRVIMSPLAAKRFHGMLTQLLDAHEARHGALK